MYSMASDSRLLQLSNVAAAASAVSYHSNHSVVHRHGDHTSSLLASMPIQRSTNPETEAFKVSSAVPEGAFLAIDDATYLNPYPYVSVRDHVNYVAASQ
jgi:hypothetical protein